MLRDLYIFLPFVLMSVFRRSVSFEGSKERFVFELSNIDIFLLLTLFSEIAELVKLESLQKN